MLRPARNSKCCFENGVKTHARHASALMFESFSLIRSINLEFGVTADLPPYSCMSGLCYVGGS